MLQILCKFIVPMKTWLPAWASAANVTFRSRRHCRRPSGYWHGHIDFYDPVQEGDGFGTIPVRKVRR